MGARGHEPDKVMGALARHLIADMLREGRTFEAVAEVLGVSKTLVVEVRNERRQPGAKLVQALADAFYAGSLDQLHRAARDLAEGKRPASVMLDAYPCRRAALSRLEGLLVPAVEDAVRAAEPVGAGHWDEEAWIDYALGEQRRARQVPTLDAARAQRRSETGAELREMTTKARRNAVPRQSKKDRSGTSGG